MAGIERLLEFIMDKVVRTVLDVANFLQDDEFFLFEVLRIEARIADKVGEHIDSLFEMFVQHTSVKAGMLLAREGIEVPTEGFERPRDLASAVTPSTLKHHVFDEMRDTIR